MAHTEVQSGPRGSKWPTQKSEMDQAQTTAHDWDSLGTRNRL